MINIEEEFGPIGLGHGDIIKEDEKIEIVNIHGNGFRLVVQ